MKLKKDFGTHYMPLVQGIGIDIEEVNRFRCHDVKIYEAFYRKIFTDKEIRYCTRKHDPYPSFTARFAAKEAVAKAIGKTMFHFNDIEILNEKSGCPTAVIRSHPAYVIKISLAHTRMHGAAIALWLR